MKIAGGGAGEEERWGREKRGRSGGRKRKRRRTRRDCGGVREEGKGEERAEEVAKPTEDVPGGN